MQRSSNAVGVFYNMTACILVGNNMIFFIVLSGHN